MKERVSRVLPAGQAGFSAAEYGSAQHAVEHVDCGIIIVSYNSARHIGKLLDTVPAATEGVSTRCIVVDNASSDETMAIARARADAEAVGAGRNLGYAGAINLGRRILGSCACILILNPDMELEPGAVTRLHDALGEPSVGIAVPMLLNGDGSLYRSMRREPSVTRALGEALFGAHWPGRPGWLSETIRDHIAYQQPQDVAWAGGAALLISAACHDAVGEWDEGRFFLYSEETDFATRARRCGYRVRYVAAARARHEDGGSGRSPVLAALMAVNRIRYYEKYHRRPATSLFRAAVVLHSLLRLADPGQRLALRYLANRSRWHELPGGDSVDQPASTALSR